MKNKNFDNKIKAEFETPEVPFEEWASKNNVFERVKNANVETTFFDETDVGNGQIALHKARKLAVIIGSTALALLLALFLTLYFVIPRSSEPEFFGINDIIINDITMEEVASVKDIYIFDTSAIVKSEGVTKDILKKDNSKALLYSVNNNLLSVNNENGPDVFYLTYKIRTYSRYNFLNIEQYSGCDKKVSVNNMEINYKITDITQPRAYASFKINNYDYYIEACGFDNVTVLTEANFLNLLNKIII